MLIQQRTDDMIRCAISLTADDSDMIYCKRTSAIALYAQTIQALQYSSIDGAVPVIYRLVRANRYTREDYIYVFIAMTTDTSTTLQKSTIFFSDLTFRSSEQNLI